MKKYLTLLIGALFMVFSCKKDKPVVPPPPPVDLSYKVTIDTSSEFGSGQFTIVSVKKDDPLKVIVPVKSGWRIGSASSGTILDSATLSFAHVPSPMSVKVTLTDSLSSAKRALLVSYLTDSAWTDRQYFWRGTGGFPLEAWQPLSMAACAVDIRDVYSKDGTLKSYMGQTSCIVGVAPYQPWFIGKWALSYNGKIIDEIEDATGKHYPANVVKLTASQFIYDIINAPDLKTGQPGGRDYEHIATPAH
jgi:hypothetical protein